MKYTFLNIRRIFLFRKSIDRARTLQLRDSNWQLGRFMTCFLHLSIFPNNDQSRLICVSNRASNRRNTKSDPSFEVNSFDQSLRRMLRFSVCTMNVDEFYEKSRLSMQSAAEIYARLLNFKYFEK